MDGELVARRTNFVGQEVLSGIFNRVGYFSAHVSQKHFGLVFLKVHKSVTTEGDQKECRNKKRTSFVDSHKEKHRPSKSLLNKKCISLGRGLFS